MFYVAVIAIKMLKAKSRTELARNLDQCCCRCRMCRIGFQMYQSFLLSLTDYYDGGVMGVGSLFCVLKTKIAFFCVLHGKNIFTIIYASSLMYFFCDLEIKMSLFSLQNV